MFGFKVVCSAVEVKKWEVWVIKSKLIKSIKREQQQGRARLGWLIKGLPLTLGLNLTKLNIIWWCISAFLRTSLYLPLKCNFVPSKALLLNSILLSERELLKTNCNGNMFWQLQKDIFGKKNHNIWTLVHKYARIVLEYFVIYL